MADSRAAIRKYSFKPYLIEFSSAMLAYALLLVVSLRWLAAGVEGEFPRVLITLLPMLPVLAMCWIVLRELRRIDELQRRIQLEALALAFCATAVATLGYGFLENVGLPRLTMFAVWPVMATTWMSGVWWGNRRFRRGEGPA